MGSDNFLKVDDDNLERCLKERGFKPTYTLPCVRGKSVYLHLCCKEIYLEIKKYNSFLTKLKKVWTAYF